MDGVRQRTHPFDPELTSASGSYEASSFGPEKSPYDRPGGPNRGYLGQRCLPTSRSAALDFDESIGKAARLTDQTAAAARSCRRRKSDSLKRWVRPRDKSEHYPCRPHTGLPP